MGVGLGGVPPLETPITVFCALPRDHTTPAIPRPAGHFFVFSIAKTSHNPMDWRPEERLAALQQSYGLLGEDLNAWCRERGVFAHQLEQWKANFCSHNEVDRQREEVSALRTLKVENQSLERELLRKDKALAEAAALLVLQKKFRALLGGEVE